MKKGLSETCYKFFSILGNPTRLAILEALDGVVPVVKPQVAFFEQLGWRGMRVLDGLCRRARALDLLVLLDAADPAHDALNERLISEAGALVDLLHGQLRLATVYELPRTALKSDADRAAFQKATEARLLDRLQAFARTGTPAPAGLHVMTGDLAQSADQLASSFQAGIIVVGTAARRGMERLWLGNNAETLLFQQTDRDLLLVPDA